MQSIDRQTVFSTPSRLRSAVARGRTVAATALLGGVLVILIGVADEPPASSGGRAVLPPATALSHVPAPSNADGPPPALRRP